VATNVPAAASEVQSSEPAGQVAATEVAIGGEPTVSATAGAPDNSSVTVEPVEIHPSVASSAESGGKPAKAAATGGEGGSLEPIASADELVLESVAADSDKHESNQPHDDSGSREPDPLTNQSPSPPLGNGEQRPLDFKPDQANQSAESKGQATNSPAPPISSAAAADAPRLRLPAEILVPAGATARPGTGVEIDAARLLHRVARAFAQAADRNGEVTIRLSPHELGALRLEVQVREGALTARLQAETPEARTAILENLSALRERLAEQGVRIERFDVDLMNRQSGGSPQQAFSDQRESPRTWRPANEANSATKPPTTVPQLSKTTATGPGRLNVIV
jgi:flagellar hook-length control protein FliK